MAKSFGKPSGKGKTPAIYPYPMGSEIVAKRKGKDASCPNCGVYSQIANKTKGKSRLSISREVNKGPVKKY